MEFSLHVFVSHFAKNKIFFVALFSKNTCPRVSYLFFGVTNVTAWTKCYSGINCHGFDKPKTGE
jgi:hypothetical protein